MKYLLFFLPFFIAQAQLPEVAIYHNPVLDSVSRGSPEYQLEFEKEIGINFTNVMEQIEALKLEVKRLNKELSKVKKDLRLAKRSVWIKFDTTFATVIRDSNDFVIEKQLKKKK